MPGAKEDLVLVPRRLLVTMTDELLQAAEDKEILDVLDRSHLFTDETARQFGRRLLDHLGSNSSDTPNRHATTAGPQCQGGNPHDEAR